MTAPDKARFKNLQRIVPAEPQPDEEIQLLGLELYDDGLAVRWGVLPGGSELGDNVGLDPVQLTQLTFGALPSVLPSPFPETIEDASPFEHMKVGDDVGTTYEAAGWSGEAIRGVAYFEPAIPDAAASFSVSVRDELVRFDLRS